MCGLISGCLLASTTHASLGYDWMSCSKGPTAVWNRTYGNLFLVTAICWSDEIAPLCHLRNKFMNNGGLYVVHWKSNNSTCEQSTGNTACHNWQLSKKELILFLFVILFSFTALSNFKATSFENWTTSFKVAFRDLQLVLCDLKHLCEKPS